VSRCLWTVLLLIGADQLTKGLAQANFFYGERFAVLPFFDLTLVYNTGAAFSFLAGGSGWQRWFLIAIAVAAIFFIVWMIRTHPQEPRLRFALTLILGGAIGNLIDRVWHGYVIDFLSVYWNQWYFPAFNVADAAITLGAILLIIDEWQRWRRSRKTSQAGSQ
jgi:signal peptidase II